MKIKKGDRVVVIAGKDKGREGTVILTDPEKQRVIVQGVSMIKKNTKVNYQGRRGAKEGGIVHQEALIHVSNVALIDPDTKKAARAGYRSTTARRRSGSPGQAVRTSDGCEQVEQGQRWQGRRKGGDPGAQPAATIGQGRVRWHVDRPSAAARAGAEAPPRLKERYQTEIAPALREEFGFANVMQVPTLTKIVVNMGVGEAAQGRQADRGRGQGPDADHRPEAGGRAGAQVDRPVQAQGGHADRRARDAARSADVGVLRPAAVARAAADP